MRARQSYLGAGAAGLLGLLGALAASQGVLGDDRAALRPLPEPPSVDERKAALGRDLFFDTRLSGDSTVSCASCHQPSEGWSDGEPLSRGYTGVEYFRNTPGLMNTALREYFMWDARLDGDDLATLVRDKVTEAHFMNADSRIVQERLKQVPEYRQRWREIFGEDSDPYGPQMYGVIGEFLKTLVTGGTPLDRYLAGETDALSDRQRRGLALFRGDAGCIECHSGALASDGELHRLGVPENPAIAEEPLRGITMLRHYATFGVPGYMNLREDVGHYAVTKDDADRGRFLTPPLREVVHTPPYMHNGVFATLDEVVAFYDRGGGPDSELEPLGLSAGQREALVAFLEAMSSDSAIEMAKPDLPGYELLSEDAE